MEDVHSYIFKCTKLIYEYKNTKAKASKAIWFNKMCKIHELIQI